MERRVSRVLRRVRAWGTHSAFPLLNIVGFNWGRVTDLEYTIGFNCGRVTQ